MAAMKTRLGHRSWEHQKRLRRERRRQKFRDAAQAAVKPPVETVETSAPVTKRAEALPETVMQWYLPKFNIDPEKLPSQQENSLPTIIFQGLC